MAACSFSKSDARVRFPYLAPVECSSVADQSTSMGLSAIGKRHLKRDDGA